MKCNYKRQIQQQLATSDPTARATVKRLWELLALLTLHHEFGFGRERLKRFADSMNDICAEFMTRSAATDKYDKKHRELSDIDTAIIRVLQELRKDGIDHRDILGSSEELVMIDENGTRRNLDDVLDNIERWEKRG